MKIGDFVTHSCDLLPSTILTIITNSDYSFKNPALIDAVKGEEVSDNLPQYSTPLPYYFQSKGES